MQRVLISIEFADGYQLPARPRPINVAGPAELGNLVSAMVRLRQPPDRALVYTIEAAQQQEQAQ